jgi:hypothetical protein
MSRTISHAIFLAVVTVVAPSCKSCNEEPPPSPPSNSGPAPIASDAHAASVTAPTPTTPSSDPTVTADAATAATTPPTACTITPAAAFHLRATATLTSSGPEFPAGTALDGLAPAVPQGGESPLRRRAQTLFRVRVRSTGAEGFTFAGPTELGRDCPLVWPQLIMQQRTGARPATQQRNAEREAAVRAAIPSADADRFADVALQGTAIDLDGDGALDELVKLDTDDEPFPATHLAVFRANGAYLAQSLSTDHIVEHASFAHSSNFADPVRSASAPWLLVHWQESSSEDIPPVNDAQSYTLLRCRRGGPCESVLYAFTLFGTDESWSFAETPSGDLRVTSSIGGRTQVLRWDAAAWRLTL